MCQSTANSGRPKRSGPLVITDSALWRSVPVLGNIALEYATAFPLRSSRHRTILLEPPADCLESQTSTGRESCRAAAPSLGSDRSPAARRCRIPQDIQKNREALQFRTSAFLCVAKAEFGSDERRSLAIKQAEFLLQIGCSPGVRHWTSAVKPLGCSWKNRPTTPFAFPRPCGCWLRARTVAGPAPPGRRAARLPSPSRCFFDRPAFVLPNGRTTGLLNWHRCS